MTSPSSPNPRPRAASSGAPAATLLADPATRAIVALLGAAGSDSLDAPQIAASLEISLTGRLVRDRLRVLERRNVVVATSRAASDGSAPTRWTLTDAGRDLHRLVSLITRIAAHAARLPEAQPTKATDAVVGCTLSALDDPVVRVVGRQLGAADHLGPLELEAACPEVPRRTLYRRLGPLVDAGAIVRETTRQVPRSTRYSFADRWRPVVAVLVLIAWWESRHPDEGSPPVALDLEGAMTVVAPRVRLRRAGATGVVRWEVLAPDGTSTRFDVTADGATVTTGASAATEPAALVRARVEAWTAALVEGNLTALEITGDADLAEAVLAGFRAALLAYVR